MTLKNGILSLYWASKHPHMLLCGYMDNLSLTYLFNVLIMCSNSSWNQTPYYASTCVDLTHTSMCDSQMYLTLISGVLIYLANNSIMCVDTLALSRIGKKLWKVNCWSPAKYPIEYNPHTHKHTHINHSRIRTHPASIIHPPSALNSAKYYSKSFGLSKPLLGRCSCTL